MPARLTLFRLLMQERQWDNWSVFAGHFGRAARDVALKTSAPRLMGISVARRTFDRWMVGELKGMPQRDTRVVLKHLLGFPCTELFGPPPDVFSAARAVHDRGGLAASIAISDRWPTSRLFMSATGDVADSWHIRGRRLLDGTTAAGQFHSAVTVGDAVRVMAAVPELQQVGGIESIDFRQSPGASLTIDDVAELAARLRLETEHGAQGIVVTQEPDTLEETAFLLDLLYQEDTPVILTGAMRNPTLAGADCPANLLAAVRTAASPQARGRGVLVVFADEIHTARHVRKVHSTSISAFASPSAGPIGHVVEGVARFHFDAGRSAGVRSTFRRPSEVELIEVSLGSGGVLLDGLEEKVDGLVVAAFGAGYLPAAWVSRVEKIAAHIPVVLSTRTNAGSVLRSTYTFPGSERDLLSRGVIRGGSLDARKARLLLLAHLRAGSDQDAIVRAFAPYC